MKRIISTIAAALALVGAVVAVGAASASAKPPGGERVRAADGRTNLQILGRSQEKVLKAKVLTVRVNSTRSRKLRIRARTSTFDDPQPRPLTKSKRVRLPKTGKRIVKLRLKRNSLKRIASCEIRDIQVVTRHSRDTVPLRRNTNGCQPGPVDLSAADRCDFIADQDESVCMLPFPSDYYLRTAGTRTGQRVDFKTAAMPANAANVHIDAAPYNLNDGFSPGQSIVVKAPGLDTPAAMAQTDPVSLDALSEHSRPNAPIVVIDQQTGERWPIWTELDSNAADPSRRALLIHPARNFEPGHRYIVAMRNLEDAGGRELEAPAGFRYLRDGIPSPEKAIRKQRDRFESIFRNLRHVGIDRADLYLAWNFTVASDENIAGRVLHMRDESLAGLGDTNLTDLIPQGTAPDFEVDVTSVQNYEPAEDPDMARRVEGTFEVPCYLFPNCNPGGRMQLDGDGLPRRSGTYTAEFNCMIPHSALVEPARPALYGHGLLGSADEATADPQKTLGDTHNIVSCATDQIGLSDEDVPNTFGILSDLSRFPELADRLQQGLLNEIFLGRLMINTDHGFAGDESFTQDGTGPGNAYVIDPSRLYYHGNSQGAIQGGALTAISPDVTRAALGVGGMNYSVLLDRSVAFETYEIPLRMAYEDELERSLILSMIQMLWDRGESNGYAHRMTDDPLPNTPRHEVLMNVALGDHLVSNYTADVMARTIGAGVHAPIVYPGRWPNVEQAWGIPRIQSYPFRDSALVYWDSGPVRPNVPVLPYPSGPQLGTAPPPIANVPNRAGIDPHELPRRTPEAQEMVSDFLQPNPASRIDDECGGPCYDLTFDGP